MSKLGKPSGNSSLSPLSVLFYGIVIAVAYKAFGDVVKMIRNMAAGRGASEAAADSQHE